jgi:thymidylate synthase ThyX
MAFESSNENSLRTEVDPAPKAHVYCLTGIDPEIHAYAMAKYSRSSLSMKQAVQELSRQKAEQFLNTFYFQYGHRSIADLAHLSFAIENVSMLAAIAIVDETRWDGQERSSRYQNFKRSGYFVPELTEDLKNKFTGIVRNLFGEYEQLSEACFKHFVLLTPKPAELEENEYKRTIRARSFDIARYLLPLATNTSVGQIISARTLEAQISRLGGDDHPEVRHVATMLKAAASSAPYDFRVENLKTALKSLKARHSDVDFSDLDELLTSAAVAPTLVKYADAKSYDLKTKSELSDAAKELMQGLEIDGCNGVTLVEPGSLEIEVAATLLYERSHHAYQQIVEVVSALSARRRQEILNLGTKHRGPYDELIRPYAAGQSFQFDILMDIGGFRDLHRHRRCVQILQPYTAAHGYEMPEEVEAVGWRERFHTLMTDCRLAWEGMTSALDAKSGSSFDYVLPLAFRRRALFKMDLAEAIYICELRTGVGGHPSYRRIAYAMYDELRRKCPGLAAFARVQDRDIPVDLLKR